MPRKIRCIIPHLPHHTLQRGNNRQIVFPETIDKLFFLRQLKKYSEENEVQVGAYCLMTNHFHLLVYPQAEEGLIKLMKSISQIYSQYFNRKYERTGKVWENRYKLNIVEPESEWVIARYIERNPLRAGMVLNSVKYPYSSAKTNFGGSANKIVTKDIVGNRREEYISFFNESEASDGNKLYAIRTIIQQEKGFGKSSFIEGLKDRFQINFEPRERGRPRKMKVIKK